MHQKQPPPMVASCVSGEGLASGPSAFMVVDKVSAAARQSAVMGNSFAFIKSVFVRAVEVFAAGEVFVLLKMIGTQRLGEAVVLVEPFAEIDELAPLRAKGADWLGE